MSRPHTYLCPACREVLTVGEARPTDSVFTCPVRECAREIWHRFAAKDESGRTRLTLGSTDIPDLESAIYVVDRGMLLEHGAEVLIGPPDALKQMARDLNADPPAHIDLADRIREMIQATPYQGVFIPGGLLISSGSLAIARKREAFRDA